MRHRSFAALCASVLFMAATTACIGSFPLSVKLARWNNGVSDSKWVRELVFLGTIVIPVRECAALADMFFTNAVEFWTGSNPMAAVPGATKYVKGPNGESAFMTLHEDGMIDVTVFAPGKPVQRLALARNGESIDVYEVR